MKRSVYSPLSLCTRVYNNKCAPSLDQAIYRFLQNRLLTTSFTVDSTELSGHALAWSKKATETERTALDWQSLFRVVTQVIRHVLPFDQGSLALYDSARDVLAMSDLADRV